eukprot:CAMPEP_0178382936 /NCGR_PEP_ID=MMETSP0689_2-20121128/6747_1 /TAXON_ID=160604 /ORGANISM="Amphidinium massartii, Strain CS-259" /LENGTH=499 /DNA_ID=CAMNT_0020003149 /DNA_START=105 /DNA_END=1604 /DNA_ORIENTATION=-
MVQNRSSGSSSWTVGDKRQDRFDFADLKVVQIAHHHRDHDLEFTQAEAQEEYLCQICHRRRFGNKWRCHKCVLDFCSYCVQHSVQTETRFFVTQANRELPKGWKSSYDMETRRYYYYNLFTGQRSWSRPRQDTTRRSRNVAEALNDARRARMEAMRSTSPSRRARSTSPTDGGGAKTPRSTSEKRQQIDTLLETLTEMESVGYTCRGQDAEKAHEAFRRFHAALMKLTRGTYSLPPDLWDNPVLTSSATDVVQLMHEVHSWSLCRCAEMMFIDVLMIMTATPAWHETIQVKARKLPRETYDFLVYLGESHSDWGVRLKGGDNFYYSMGNLTQADKRRDEMLRDLEPLWAEEAMLKSSRKSSKHSSHESTHDGHSQEHTPRTISKESVQSTPNKRNSTSGNWPTYKFRPSSSTLFADLSDLDRTGAEEDARKLMQEISQDMQSFRRTSEVQEMRNNDATPHKQDGRAPFRPATIPIEHKSETVKEADDSAWPSTQDCTVQ